MFSLDWFYQLHMYLITLGVVSIMASVYIIKFKKDKKWRITRHQQLMLVGVTFIIAGVATMFLGKQSEGLEHFSVPHAFGGSLALIMMIGTMTLARLGMKGNKKLLNLHRIFGRITAVLVLLVALVGLTVIIGLI